MADDVKALSAELAQDPQSLVFLRLGELLRRKGQVEAAQRVAVHGLERHPHLPDAHDLYARILSDARDYARAFDEWDMALQIMPTHAGALKGLAFLYFQVGDLEQAETHLQAALDASPGDASLVQALEVVRGHGAARSAGDTTPGAPSRPPAPAASPPTAGSGGGGGGGGGAVDDARVFAGLEGATSITAGPRCNGAWLTTTLVSVICRRQPHPMAMPTWSWTSVTFACMTATAAAVSSNPTWCSLVTRCPKTGSAWRWMRYCAPMPCWWSAHH
jgi:hypothetical protein